MTLQKRPAPISADLYDRFIVEVGRRIGLKEGAVKEALEEAITFQKLHGPLQFRSHLMDLNIMPKEEVNQISFLYDNLIYQKIKNRY